MTRFIYLAYPIDATAERSDEWLLYVDFGKNVALDNGLGIYDPGDAFSIPNPTPGQGGELPGSEIRKTNHQAQSRCAGVLAYLPDGVSSIGVPIEIHKALQGWGQPVALISNIQSWALGDHPGLRTFEQSQYGIIAAVCWLKQQVEQQENQPPGRDPLLWKDVRTDEQTLAQGEDGPFTVDVTPRKAFEDDAGFDLVVSEDTTVLPGDTAEVPCGIAIELPAWTFGMLVARSSTGSRGLRVHPAIIDPGWRGELFVIAESIRDVRVEVKAGERIAQLLVLNNAALGLVPARVDELSPHERGVRGFGSSGR